MNIMVAILAGEPAEPAGAPLLPSSPPAAAAGLQPPLRLLQLGRLVSGARVALACQGAVGSREEQVGKGSCRKPCKPWLPARPDSQSNARGVNKDQKRGRRLQTTLRVSS